MANPVGAVVTVFVLFLGCAGALTALTRSGQEPDTSQSSSALLPEADASAGNDAAVEPLVVFAGASATDALTELGAQFERKTGIPVRLNFASSSTLARQIVAGAPADVYLSANPQWMDHVAEHDKIDPASRFDLLSNRIVLIAPKGKGFSVSIEPNFDLAGKFTGRLALGNPDHVPAGIYAKQALKTLGWYDTLESRFAPCANVRAALAMVELGETPVGIVYATDAVVSTKVERLALFPEETHEPIRFPIAQCRDASPAAGRFIAFLQTQQAAEVFRRNGFTPLVAQDEHGR